MKVYRLEANGVGIYQTRNFIGKLRDAVINLNKEHRDDEHPSVYKDFNCLDKIEDYCELFCACDSIESLKRWFNNGWWETLLAFKSVKLVEYETDEYYYSDSYKQLLFRPNYNIFKCFTVKRNIRKTRKVINYGQE